MPYSGNSKKAPRRPARGLDRFQGDGERAHWLGAVKDREVSRWQEVAARRRRRTEIQQSRLHKGQGPAGRQDASPLPNSIASSAKYPMVRLVEAKGVKLKGRGENLIGQCPFHDDKTPSLVISPTKNLWHCLGACQAGGYVIDWVMKAERVSFRHAVEMLRSGPVFSGSGNRAAAAAKQSSSSPRSPRSPIRRAGQVLDYYPATLKQCTEAQRYLEKRGLQSSEMVEHFKLGFSNRTLG